MRTLISGCFGLLLFLGSAPAAEDGVAFDRLYEQWKAQFDACKYAQAEQTAKRLVELAEGPLRGEPTRLADAVLWQGRAVQQQRRHADAQALYLRSLDIRQRSIPEKHVNLYWCWNNLGLACFDQGRYADAERYLRTGIAVGEEVVGRESVALSVCLNNLGRTYQRLGRYGESEKTHQRALAMREKALPEDHSDVVQSLNNLADVYRVTYRYAEAERLAQRALQADEKARPDDPVIAWSLNNLALVYDDLGRCVEAEKLYRRALEVREKHLPPDDPHLFWSLHNLGSLCVRIGRHAEAEKLLRRALGVAETAFGPEHLNVATCLDMLATARFKQLDFDEAERLYQRAHAIREKRLGPAHRDVAVGLSGLADVYYVRGRYEEAEKLYRRVLEARQAKYGPDDPEVAWSLTDLGAVFELQGRFEEAEQQYQRGLAIREKALPPNHPDLINSLNALGTLYLTLSNYREAEPLCKRAIEIGEQLNGVNDPIVARGLVKLGVLYSHQGRFAEAETVYKRALASLENAIGPEHPIVDLALAPLAEIYYAQQRYAEAAPLYRRALLICQRALPPTHSSIAAALTGLALVYSDQGRPLDAIPLARSAVTINEQGVGAAHPEYARSVDCLALILRAAASGTADPAKRQELFAEAESLHRRALRINEAAYGANHPLVAAGLAGLAALCAEQRRDAEAKPLLDRAIAINDRAAVPPGVRCRNYFLRAELAWRRQQRREALGDLQQAMNLAEQQRGTAAGAAHERARAFAQFAPVFERMIAWQNELGNVDESFRTMERARARSLLDQFATCGIELLSGVPDDVVRHLQRRERDAQIRTVRLETLLERLGQRVDLAADERQAEREKLEDQLRAARQESVAVYADIRSASPAYQLAAGRDRKAVTLARLQRWAIDSRSLVLEYMLGEQGGCVLVVRPGAAPRIVPLAVDETDARLLGTSAGPLTAVRLQKALANRHSTGLVQLLASTGDLEEVPRAIPRLAALWRILVPEAERAALVAKQPARLIVIPDGPLHWLPFETLVVQEGPQPQYLLDSGVPVAYSPSATVLFELAARPKESPRAGDDAVLVAGDPVYPQRPAAGHEGALDPLKAGGRYSRLVRWLNPLPYSPWEIKWVAEVFRARGVPVTVLQGSQATEANIRLSATGRRIVLLACHGLVDEAYGNFFGALALTPAPSGPEAPDDGFLTLPEIYELRLKGCELTILSACQTNFGPEQRGEGVWALSRGFLVAGSRRVVASNWLVDDEATANLVSLFCNHLAEAERKGRPVDYAEALQKAKRWIRQQEQWSSPYYWAGLVLVGPNE